MVEGDSNTVGARGNVVGMVGAPVCARVCVHECVCTRVFEECC